MSPDFGKLEVDQASGFSKRRFTQRPLVKVRAHISSSVEGLLMGVRHLSISVRKQARAHGGRQAWAHGGNIGAWQEVRLGTWRKYRRMAGGKIGHMAEI